LKTCITISTIAVLAAWGSIVGPSAAWGGPIGSAFQISSSTGRFPDVAYNSTNGKYLVVYTNYNFSPPRISGRLVTGAGAASGNEFFICGATGGLMPSVTYNASDNEFLVTWDDQRASPEPIWGQRIRGTDGQLLGGNFRISSAGGIRSAVAWSSTNNSYLVVWYIGPPWEIYGQRVGNTGTLLGLEFNISNDPLYSGYPAIAYGQSGNQFLVTWDYDDGNIRGRQVDAGNGNLLGGIIQVTTIGACDRSCIAYDHANSRWLVQYNYQGTPGNSYDQRGQFISTSGTLDGSSIAIATTTAFEGDTLFGGDIAFDPGATIYFSSFQRYIGENGGICGQEVRDTGMRLGTQINTSTGDDFSLNNAADTNLHRFLAIWGRMIGNVHYIHGQLYEPTDLIPPDPVTNLSASPGSRLIELNWTNPSTADFTGTMIRYKTTGSPTGPTDGQLVVDKPNAPGSSDSFIHPNLPSGVVHYYVAFAHDDGPNYAVATTVNQMPGTFGDLDTDDDVDQEDFGLCQACYSRPGNNYQTGCEGCDYEGDDDVDQDDFNQFQSCMGGANNPPICP